MATMMQQGMAQQGVALPGAAPGRAPWEDPSPESENKELTPEDERRVARDAAARDHPHATPAELELFSMLPLAKRIRKAQARVSRGFQLVRDTSLTPQDFGERCKVGQF